MVIELRLIVGVSNYEFASCNNQCSHITLWLHNFNNTRSNIIMSKEINDKKFFIIEKEIFLGTPKYSIHKGKMYDLTTAVKKLLALDTLNEDRENNSYHLQKVDLSIVETPLVLTDEVKEEQSEMPF